MHQPNPHEADASPTGGAGSSNTSERLLRLPQVLELTGRVRTSTLDDVKAGTFLRPIKVGSASLWVASEVQAWIAERVRKARAGQ